MKFNALSLDSVLRHVLLPLFLRTGSLMSGPVRKSETVCRPAQGNGRRAAIATAFMAREPWCEATFSFPLLSRAGRRRSEAPIEVGKKEMRT